MTPDEILEGWEKVKLACLCKKIQAGGTPTSTNEAYYSGNTPFVLIEDITNSGKYLSRTIRNITPDAIVSCNTWLVPENSLLYTIYASVGEVCINKVPVTTNQAVLNIIPDTNRITLEFFYYWLKWYKQFIHYHTSQTTQRNLNAAIVRNFDLIIPKSIKEQQKIASILRSIDNTINKTKELIEKHKMIKQGLMQDLFTRGIQPNGKLRPPLENASELYRDSVLGKIPREWGIETLSSICTDIVDCPHTTPVFRKEGVIVARTSSIRDGIFDQYSASYISEEEYEERVMRLRPNPGDIIFTREAPVGEAFIIPERMKICLGQRTMLLRPDSAGVDARYILLQIYSDIIRKQTRRLVGGTTNPHLNVSNVHKFLFLVPSLDEQIRISSVFDVYNRLSKEEQAYFAKLSLIKQGLMHDLLTGKVRVKVEECQENTHV
jgi:type I restriction enzyme S subunit